MPSVRSAPVAVVPMVVMIALVALVATISCADQGTVATQDVGTVIRGDTIMIDGTTPSCATCTLEVTLAARIGDVNDPQIPQLVPRVLRDTRGTHYLMFKDVYDQPILRYDSLGHYVGTLGRLGQGPGEYEITRTIFLGADDSLYLASSGRIQVFDRNGRYSRVLPGIRSWSIGITAGSDPVLYSRRVPSRDEGVILVHDADGTVRDSILPYYYQVVMYNPIVGGDGSLWIYMDGIYRLERIGRDGRTTKLLGVAVAPHGHPDFVTRAGYDSIFSGLRRVRHKAPSITDVSVDTEGLLWVLRPISSPGRDTMNIIRQHLSPDVHPEEVTIPREQEDRMYHTIVEVIDPERGQLLARTEVPFLAMAARPGYVARVTTDGDGAYVTEVYRLTLRRDR
jgi:hypothetical protein